MTPRIRVFVAIGLSEAVRAELARSIPPRAGPARPPQGLRWLSPSNWHLTLQFLGYVEEERLQAVREACGRAAASRAPFELAFEGAGAFPSSRRARVVWIGVSRGYEPLAALAEALLHETEPLGFEREQRPFRAHLTVGRLKEPASVEPLLAALQRPALPMPVRELTLYRSHLSSRGAEYEALASWPLG